MNKAICLFAAALAAAAAHAAPVDLTTWSGVNLDFPGDQGAANWALQPGNETVIQTINADPSFFLNNLNQTAFSMQGSWKVGTSGDDDFMGFVFGYQNSSNFYLFDWKQSAQGSGPAFAAEGMTVKKFTGATGNGLADLSVDELWENEHAFGDMTVLATNHGSDKGWADNTLYGFQLDFNNVPGQFSISVTQGLTSLWNVTVNDGTFTGGQFGFYNNSQGSVEYTGFTQEGGVIVQPPPPASSVPDGGSSLAMCAIALAGLATVKMRRKS